MFKESERILWYGKTGEIVGVKPPIDPDHRQEVWYELKLDNGSMAGAWESELKHL